MVMDTETFERAKKARQVARDVEDFLIELQSMCHIFGAEAEKEVVRARLLTDIMRDDDNHAVDGMLIWHRNYHLKATITKLRKIANALPGIELTLLEKIPGLVLGESKDGG
jgi:hypothetical protein